MELMRILLFDIDLTLIHSSGAGRLAMDRALEKTIGVPEATAGIRFDGRTDRAIFLETLGKHTDDAAARADGAMAAYLSELPAALEEKGGKVMPGVHELIEALRGEPVIMGLATGNMQRGAELKLRHFGLWEHFRGGGFGDVAVVRSEIITQAVESLAHAHETEPMARQAVVIGDTPLDIEAAIAAGTRSLGVATGRFSVEELLDAGADAAVDDLTDTARVVELLVG